MEAAQSANAAVPMQDVHENAVEWLMRLGKHLWQTRGDGRLAEHRDGEL